MIVDALDIAAEIGFTGPVTGTIAQVRTRAVGAPIDFALAEYPGVSFRLSGFARPRPVIPAVGTRVHVERDRRGFVITVRAA